MEAAASHNHEMDTVGLHVLLAPEDAEARREDAE